MHLPATEPMLSARQVAAEFGIAVSTVYDWIHAGLLPKPVKLGKRTSRWRVKDVEALKFGRRGLSPRVKGKDAAEACQEG